MSKRFAAFWAAALFPAAAAARPVLRTGNGHYYQLVTPAGGAPWTGAKP